MGTKLYFHVNSLRKYSFVLTPNMAALPRGCKPRIEGKPVSNVVFPSFSNTILSMNSVICIKLIKMSKETLQKWQLQGRFRDELGSYKL